MLCGLNNRVLYSGRRQRFAPRWWLSGSMKQDNRDVHDTVRRTSAPLDEPSSWSRACICSAPPAIPLDSHRGLTKVLAGSATETRAVGRRLSYASLEHAGRHCRCPLYSALKVDIESGVKRGDFGAGRCRR